MLKTLRACALGLLILQPSAALWVTVPVATAGFTAQAEARPSSSGGYSRPSRSYRTPSYRSAPSYRAPSTGTWSAPRTPSVSGGYSRPSERRPSVAAPPQGYGATASDRTYSERRSAEALERMRARQEAESRRAAAPPPARPQAPTPAPPPAETRPRGGYGDFGRGGYWGTGRGYRPGGGWYANRGWTPPPYATARSFGIWDGLFLWFLLSSLSQPGHADFFRNHQDDPGVQQWRQEADRLARDNADLRRQLDQLDRQLAGSQGQPKDPDYLPPDIPPEVAVAGESDVRTPSVESGGGSWLGVLAFLALLGLLGFLASRFFGRRSKPMGGRGSVPNTGTMATLRGAGEMLRHKASGETYTPQRFRVGMTLTLDPTPFVLAAGATKVPMPKGVGANGMTSVEAVGRFEGERDFVRLHIDERSLFEIHLDAAGNPDECRYFALIDEVVPADEAEWGVWLAPREGMIGWQEFQTKDGKIYGRVWEPGPEWVEPRLRTEVVETLGGTRRTTLRSMLYAAPTGAGAPAPQAEYILVSAVEDDTGARVEIRAGIEVNPASLSLA